MAKKRLTKQGFSIQGFDVQAYKQTEAYVQAIDSFYQKAVLEFAQLATKLNIDPEKPFAFSDYPGTSAAVQKIVNELAAKMQAVIKNGSRKQWLYACQKNDQFIATILDTTKIPKKTLEKYQNRNLEALESFQKRKINGLDLSQRVWKYTDQLKGSMELGIDVAIGEGTSAAKLSKELRKYLVDPDNLFRRVRDKRGNLVLSKRAAAFKPGQGTYRSSYKNAMRLTRSEINMAYKVSDQLRWQQLDFVVGYEIKLSNNHTLNGEPFVDICDRLVGKYPKNFKFKGWHPQCRCLVVPILQDPDEFDNDELNDLKSALNGKEYPKFASRQTITDVPDSFKGWIKENAERAKNWASQPYFIRDNFKGGTIEGGLNIETATLNIVKPIIEKPKEPEPAPEPVRNVVKIVKDTRKEYQNIVAAEDSIRMNKNFETAVAFDSQGNEVFRKKGKATSVSFDGSELRQLENTIFTHNHPRSFGLSGFRKVGNSFSPADVLVSISTNVAEVRAVTPYYTFSMKRPQGGWMSKSQAERAINQINKELTKENWEYIGNAKNQDAAIEKAEAIHFHLLWKRFCSKYGIEYTKAKTKG